jgi:hypothetical protein
LHARRVRLPHDRLLLSGLAGDAPRRHRARRGRYSAQEILDAFVETYGEVALMAPKREGFNWAGYLVPFGALAAGARRS